MADTHAEDVHMNHQDMSLSPVYHHSGGGEQFETLSDGTTASLHVCDGCVQSSDHIIYAHGGCVLCLLRTTNERLLQLERIVAELEVKRESDSSTAPRVHEPRPKPTSPYESHPNPLRGRLFMNGIYDDLNVEDIQQAATTTAPASATIPQHHLAPLASTSPTDAVVGLPGTMWPIFPDLMADLAGLNENYESAETMHLRNLLNEDKERPGSQSLHPHQQQATHHDLVFTTTDFDTTIANALNGDTNVATGVSSNDVKTGFTPPMPLSPTLEMRPRSSSPIAVPARTKKRSQKPKFMFVNETSHHFVSNGGRPVSLRQLMNSKARKAATPFQRLPKHTIIQYHPGNGHSHGHTHGSNSGMELGEDDGADIKAGEGAVHAWP